MSMSVCLSASISDEVHPNTNPSFNDFFHVNDFQGLILLWWCCSVLSMHNGHAGLRRRRARVQIAATTLSGNSLRQTVHTHHASVHQAATLVAALLRVARVTAGLVESNGSLLLGL